MVQSPKECAPVMWLHIILDQPDQKQIKQQNGSKLMLSCVKI